MTDNEIYSKSVAGVRWTYLSSILSKGFYPLILIVLARLLGPSDFGLAGMALVIINLFSCFSDLGLKHALVQQEGDKEDVATVAFWVMLILGGLWFLLLWFLSPYIASYYKNQGVVPLLRILGIVFIVQPFSDIPLSLLLRELRFKALFYRQVIPQLFSGVFSIILALMGYGAWSLIYGYIAGVTGTAVVVWKRTHWRPRIYFDHQIFRSMFRFGSFLSIQQILGWMMTRVDNLFVGRFLGPSSLGIYRMGYTYGNLPFQLIGLPFLNVAYPVFCRLSVRLEELRESYLKYVEWVSLVVIPLSVIFIFVMPFIIPLLLGEKWLASVIVLQFIAVAFIPAGIVGLNSEIYKAIGRPDIGTKFFGVRVLVSLPFYYLASQKGIVELALTHIGLACFFVPLNFLVCSFVIKVSYMNILRRLAKGAFTGVLMSAGGLLYKRFISDNIIYNPLINAVSLGIMMLIIAIITIFIIDKNILVRMLSFIKDTVKYKQEAMVS
jgi:O-antigen/teichoic acid export membrane protein